MTRTRILMLMSTLMLITSMGSDVFAAQAAPDDETGAPGPAEGYAKRLDAYGISIEATDQVRNDWLYFAALVYEHMTNHQTSHDIREQLADRGFRILLAGADQPLTELPEYAHDPEVHEAGGLGGNPGEYRIAVRTMHPHILVHELAHGIYHSAIQYRENNGSIDPEIVEAPPRPGTFTHQLKAAYDKAIDAGTWQGTYFEAHPDEYWAEGVSLWFGTLPPDELRDELDVRLDEISVQLRETDQRAFLKRHDPDLHRLVAGVFPDRNERLMDMQVFGPDETPLQVEDPGIMGLAIELQEIAGENLQAAKEMMSDIRFDILRDEGARVASEVFSDLESTLKNPELHDYAARILGELGDLKDAALGRVELPRGTPDLKVHDIPTEGRLAAFRPTFTRYTDVFGVMIVATAKTEESKIVHAANVLAEYLDNDEDGVVDDELVQRNLLEGGAFLVMFDTERDARRSRINRELIEDSGFRIGQDLYGEETIPNGPPHVRKSGRFDASLEEVLHLVSNGWRDVYPDDFGYQSGSRLTDAMDLARGGRFRRIPRRYPEGAWYHYDDETCDYECMAAEYLYWALTSHLGGQDFPGRAEEIAVEWECPTPESLKRKDPAVHELLTDERFSLPRRLPDGRYQPSGS